ncbi:MULTISPECIES: 2'-5' RNA ligase family protein [unclassified Nocardioides]|uniref:2'-5' RNA ligase family protein n=1 Tax=unclassified Nocardioides TaxID=2615069 RepID=UPI001E534F18|nr:MULTISPECIES: 2'-5' RNA ligase family protein [unclassified Nocardioides]
MGEERWPGHAVLQVPVPALEGFVRARTRHHDPAYLSPDADHVHAHVTVLGPLPGDGEGVDPETAALVAEAVAAVAPFDYRLTRIATFPDGIIHLVPEPDDGFRALTARLVEAFPQFPPYAGRFGRLADLQPHLTLDLRTDERGDPAERVTEESTRALLDTFLDRPLPLACRAERVDLAWYEQHRCRTLASWQLGGRAQL